MCGATEKFLRFVKIHWLSLRLDFIRKHQQKNFQYKPIIIVIKLAPNRKVSSNAVKVKLKSPILFFK